MTNRHLSRIRVYRGVALWLALAAFGNTQTPSKDLCSDPRDIVFIVDQSGSMAQNDPSGMRWKLVEYALSLTGKIAPYSDRVAVIPFGGFSETDRYLRSNYPAKLTPRWYDLAQYTPKQILKNVPTSHSDTTDIFSAFHYFEKYFYARASHRDLYVFFVSDGLVDLLPRDDNQRSAREQKREAEHNARLGRLLEKFGGNWRLYNISMGVGANVDYHRGMIDKIKITRRHAGGLYPGFHGAEPGNPFLLKVDDEKPSSGWPKIASAIASVLLPHSSSRHLPGPMQNGVASAPGLGSVALRLRAFVKPAIEALAFQNRLRVSFVIANAGYNVKLNPEKSEVIRSDLAVFDFVVDNSDVMTQLKTIRMTPDSIRSWQIAVHGLSPGQTVERLEVFYEHGWVVQIDKLEIAPIPPRGRSFFRRLLGMAEPCEPVLQFHAKVQNVCGEKLGDSAAVLEIVGDKKYPLQVRQTQHTDDTVGDEYEWSAEIRDSEYLLSKLGEIVTVSAFVAGRRFIFETSTVPVKVCAKY